MKLDPSEVLRVAVLARLDVDPDEAHALSRQLSDILDYVAKLEAVDTNGVPPTANAVQIPGPRRPDTVRPSLPPATAVAGAPESEGNDILVPRILA
jgi:aspartyl-tRNA(Asn)/glutamyl-tRNA(Gln) amidotransferase subunit C